MEAAGGVHGAQEPLSSPGEGARPQKTGKRKSWTAEEDAVLAADLRAHGVRKWGAVPKRAGLARSGQSCRFRWLNRIRPGLKDGVAFSREEELHLCRLHASLGNKWSCIAAEMEGRSESEVMHYWISYVNRCQQAGLNVYPPEVQLQAAAGQSDLHQSQLKRRKSQTSFLPQQPLLPVDYPNYPVVPIQLPQSLGAVNPVTMATVPPPPPPPPPLLREMVELEALPDSQFWASFLALIMNQDNVEQGRQPHPLALVPLGNTTEFNENDQRLASLLPQSNENVEQGRQPQPPLALSNENVEQGRHPPPPALPLENATEHESTVAGATVGIRNGI